MSCLRYFLKDQIRRFSFCILILFPPGLVFSQKILDYEYLPADIRWDNFLIKEGNTSQTSLSILIDRKGFLWSGTETGLYRYDGAKYIEYGVKKGDNNGFKGYGVTSIFEDSQGIIWAGTSEALNRLDQVSGTFTSIIPDSSVNEPGANFIRGINEDSQGVLWIRTGRHIYSLSGSTGKLTEYRTDSTSWYPDDYLFTVEDRCFTEDSTGNRWFIMYNSLYFFGKRDTVFRRVIPGNGSVRQEGQAAPRCVVTDRTGKVWIGTAGGGLYGWNGETGIAESIPIQPDGKAKEVFMGVSTILVANDGSLWCFGNSVFSRYDPVSKKAKNYIFIYKNRTVYEASTSQVWVDDAFQNDDGAIWFLNKRAGLMFRFDPATETLRLYRTPNFMVFQCIMDKTGSFWFASIRNNVFRMVTSGFPYLTVSIVNTSNTSQTFRGSILEDNLQNTWLLFNHGLRVIRRFDVTTDLFQEPVTFPGITTLPERGFSDSKGNLWLSLGSGKFAKYTPSAGRIKMYSMEPWEPGIPEKAFVQIREDREGNIWVLTSAPALYVIPGGTGNLKVAFDLRTWQDGFAQSGLLDFHIGRSGDFWLLTSESLLRIEMPDMKVTDFTDYGDRVFSLTASNIRVREDNSGNMYILNNRNGVYLFHRESLAFTKVNLIDEGPATEYFDLLVDSRDRLWVGHTNGITIFDIGKGTGRTIATPMLQYDLQSVQLKSGHILYINHNQLYIFNEEPQVNSWVPNVFITRIMINGNEVNTIGLTDHTGTTRKLDLRFDENNLKIEFASLNYLDPDRNRYRYFMTKYDRDTTNVPQGSAAEYKSMSPGRYRFWMTGSNNDNLWNPLGVTVDIRIHPPWHRSVLAFIIYFLALCSAIAGFIRLRVRYLMHDREKLRSRIETATAELEMKNRQLAETDRIKTHFFTDISHEIRTPLSLITGPLENIARGEVPPSRMPEMIDLMQRNADRLMNLVNQLLDISRLDAGKMKITLVYDDIIKYLRILVYEFLSMAECRHIKYVADLPEQDYVTWFDRDKTEKIVSNLLSNAFRYTPSEGNVTCTITTGSMKGFNGRQSLTVRIADSGCGISREHQARIFERFFRIEGRDESGGHGSGIGLSLVQEFVNLLHGEIRVESTPGEGSVFTVILPLGKDHLLPGEYLEVVHPGNASKSTGFDPGHWMALAGDQLASHTGKVKMKILVIEDNSDLRSYIKENLSGEFNVLLAENGKTGINWAFTVMPDLIITDIMMPDIDGLTLCRNLKNDERTSHIPVIMLTAKATIDDKIEGLRSGADDYLVKPFVMAELKTRISNLLAIRENLRKKYSLGGLTGQVNGKIMSVDDRFMQKVTGIISANLSNFDFDVEYLHIALGMSRVHLTRKLKVLTGLTPGMLIRYIRLERAAALLRNKSGNITGVAFSIGMSNPSHFTKVFKKHFGTSPKNY